VANDVDLEVGMPSGLRNRLHGEPKAFQRLKSTYPQNPAGAALRRTPRPTGQWRVDAGVTHQLNTTSAKAPRQLRGGVVGRENHGGVPYRGACERVEMPPRRGDDSAAQLLPRPPRGEQRPSGRRHEVARPDRSEDERGTEAPHRRAGDHRAVGHVVDDVETANRVEDLRPSQGHTLPRKVCEQASRPL
jgi:hypothetical protein